MDRNTALIWSYANVLTKKRYDALKDHYGSLEQALVAIDESMLKALGCREETIMGTLNRLAEFNVEVYKQELSKRDLEFISIEDEAYPALLKTIPDPPVFLYYKGSLDIVKQPCIGCVGARDMSAYGKRVVEEFIPAFVQAGLVTVSGLAYGIDTEVAKETLYAKGKTVAVVGHGLADIYPTSNRSLAKDIVSQGGVIISEYPLDMQADKHTFPARNRIIAALSMATLVLEAGKGSGSLITADLALEYGREVFVVPGQIFDDSYLGANMCIADAKGKLAVSPEKVLADVGVVTFQRSNAEFKPTDTEEAALYGALTTMPQSASDLVEKAQLDAAIITAKLTMLELQGVAKNVGNGMWVRM